jgi:rod shape determining protein RodA
VRPASGPIRNIRSRTREDELDIRGGAYRIRYALRLGDPLLFFLVVGLAFFGVAMVYSAGVLDVPFTVVAGLWRTQLMWLVVALLMMPVVMRVPPRLLQSAALPLYSLAVVLLALTLVIGTGAGTAEGVPRWIVIGPLRLHTAEFAKIPVVLMLARTFAEWREPPGSLFELWKPIAVVVPPMILVLGQPDLGTVIVFAFMLMATLYWAGTPLRLLFFLASPLASLILAFHTQLWSVWFVILLIVLWRTRVKWQEAALVFIVNVIAGTAATPFWNSLADYQKNRILVFLDPNIDPRGAGYNLIQSRVAIGSGGLTGKGYLDGTQKRLAFLPEQHTDFMFSVIGEEWGFVGVLAILLAFAVIFWRLVRISYRSTDAFASMVPFGIFSAWFIHVLVNTGMTIGIMPITGIPLPFLSYGGSFLLINLLGLAIVQRIAADHASRRL